MTSKLRTIRATARYRDLCAELARYDDGTGDLGIIIAQALVDDPQATATAIAAIIDEARAEWAQEKR
ncbi:MAG TPA: hypothetical protein VKE26_26270 [Xanthobacteraceae bacterium]|nr:hypothetical protein [Xanthobacteraceae bacterium]